MKKFLALLLGSALLLSGCAGTAQPEETASSVDLMAGVTAAGIPETAELRDEARQALAGFAVALFQNCLEEGESVLISPVSALYALAMTANGAAGETRAQMEAVLGLGVDSLNRALLAYSDALQADGEAALSMANAIWFRDDARLTVEDSFLQANASFYDAGVYRAAFDDSTCEEINAWVSRQTQGRIETILDSISDEAVLYLVNALAFDAKWAEIYREDQVRPGSFTTEAGQELEAELMVSQEGTYLEDTQAAGFLKYYAGGSYAFMALLPEEGLSVAEYAASLTGERLLDILANARTTPVNAAIPKFSCTYSAGLEEALAAMGMTDAFDADEADFSAMGSSEAGNLYISRVLHKTYLAVDEQGTQAGAATAVEIAEGTALGPEPETVYLDRPFVYVLLDCETYLPIFMGTVMGV